MPKTQSSSPGAGASASKPKLFNKYQTFMIAIISIVQFTVILDFMVLAPLGAHLMPDLNITAAQFSSVVSAYAFSAGISGLLAAGFADKFDRKKLLIFFYCGFVLGTLFCGLANTYALLLFARIITGIFGGVMGSIAFAIITDLFPLEVRGRVMGFVMMAFSVSQVAGIPIALELTRLYGWQAPFLGIVAVSVIVLLVVIAKMQPITKHLEVKHDINAFHHLWTTIRNPQYLRAFGSNALLAMGGFMLMPFGTAFLVGNAGVLDSQLSLVFGLTGAVSLVAGPLIGKASDKYGKFQVFLIGSVISAAMVIAYTNLGITPLWEVILINVILFTGITSRIISASALMSAVPDMRDRGAFMGINNSLTQIAGGTAAWISGQIVVRHASGSIEHYDTAGYICIVSMVLSALMLAGINRYVAAKPQTAPAFVPAVEH
jgi:predicted MFS family arabinose efflux permease